MRKLIVKKEYGLFVVEDPGRMGSPPIGRGKSITKALGVWLINNQEFVGYQIEVDESAMKAELKRREKELSRR